MQYCLIISSYIFILIGSLQHAVAAPKADNRQLSNAYSILDVDTTNIQSTTRVKSYAFRNDHREEYVNFLEDRQRDRSAFSGKLEDLEQDFINNSQTKQDRNKLDKAVNNTKKTYRQERQSNQKAYVIERKSNRNLLKQVDRADSQPFRKARKRN